MTPNNASALQLAQKLAAAFSKLSGVKAVALGGSQASGAAGPGSDIDLYVFSDEPIPLQQRMELASAAGYSRADLGLAFWDPGDEWIDATTGIEVDVVYWECAWIEDQLERVMVRHQASMGYTTCFWNTISKALPLYDPQCWFAGLQQSAERPYPEELRLNIIHHNHTVLRRVIPSYTHQIEKAQRRGDLVSVNHRVAALLASYFDVLFALNRLLHPGEKRLLAFAQEHCALLPQDFAGDIESLLRATAAKDDCLMQCTLQLIDRLDEFLRAQGFDPQTSAPIQ